MTANIAEEQAGVIAMLYESRSRAYRQLDEALARERVLREHILDIDAHATPFGDIPDDPGYVGVYFVTAGSLHRALGKIGHSAPSCAAEAELAAIREEA